MPIFKIKDREKVIQVNIYHVEADTKEEALAKYENELAGSLESQDNYTEYSGEEGIEVED